MERIESSTKRASILLGVSERYRCGECNRVYTPEPIHHGYSEETRLLAIRMYVEGSSYSSIGRVLKVNPQSVANWISVYTAKLPQAPLPERVRRAELDELFTFVGKKKNEIYVLTIVDRDAHCVLSWDVVEERATTALQACLERAPQARYYYSDAFPVYDLLYYGASYDMRTDKQETYSMEAINADLRHYLKRLARKSRCFTRRTQSLAKNIRLFVYCYNHTIDSPSLS